MLRRVKLLTSIFMLLAISLIQQLSLQLFPTHAQEKVTEKKSAQGATVQNADNCDTSPIAGLNEGLQLRFQKTDNGLSLGMRRALPQRQRYHMSRNPNYALTFSPNTVQEIMAIDQLEEEGWKVGFYLVGRSILGEKPEKALWEDPKSEYYARKPINNPLLITENTKANELPSAWELWDEAKKAMMAFENRNQYDFVWGAWSIAARPIRASQQACLQCHLENESLVLRGRAVIALPDNLSEAAKSGQHKDSIQESKLKIGDPLGVALYAYKHKQQVSPSRK